MCAQVVYFQFDLTQKYAEFIVGSITWRSANKFHDYALLFTFVIGFLILIRLIFNVISGLSRKCGSDCIEQLHDFFAYLCVPAGLWFIGLLSSKSDALLLLNFSGILLLTALFFLSIFLSKARKFFQCEAFQFISMFRGIFFILFAVGFVVISLGLLGSRLSGLFHFKSYINSNIVFDVVVGGEIFAIIWLSTAIVVSETIKQLEIKFQKALFVLQCFLPALFLILIPTPWVDEGQLVIGYPLTAAAFSIILLCIGATYFDLFRCYQRNKTISILCLIAILLFLKITPVLAPVISLDDYHFGELLVPWWSWSKQHLVPFWDYAPARGLVNYLNGAASDLFFDGKVTSFQAGTPFVYLGMLMIALPILSKSMGLFPAFLALFFMPYINYFSEIDVLNTVFICFLCQRFFNQKLLFWFMSYFILSLAIIVFAPGQGGLTIISMLPLGLYLFCDMNNEDKKLLLKSLFPYVFIICLLGLLTPLGKMVFGAIRYAIEQSGVNSTANGVEWRLSMFAHEGNPWLREMVRASWMIVPLWAGIILLKQGFIRGLRAKQVLVVYAMPILILTTLFIVRAAGRIDLEGPSRLGLASIWSLALLLPLLIFTTRKFRYDGALVFVWVLLLGLIYPSFGGVIANYQNNFNAQAYPEKITENQHLQKMQLILDKVLMPNETYLDLTNRHAHYFYMNRRPPIEVGAFYNLITESQQIRAIESFKKIKPPVILIGDDNILHDGGPASLRAYLLYRYLLLNSRYQVLKIDNMVWLMKSDRIGLLDKNDISHISAINDSPSNVLRDVFRIGFLENIPASWGLSFSTLQDKMKAVGHVAGGNDNSTIDISRLHLKGRDIGILSVDFACEKTSDRVPVIKLYWSSSTNPESEATVLRFNGSNGRLLVPVDADPAWLLAPQILSLRFVLEDPTVCRIYRVDNLTLYQRGKI